MSQVATTIRMDSELKRKFDSLCEEFGMSVNTAFNIFAKAVVRTHSIPFSIKLESSDPRTRLMNAVNKIREDSSTLDISLDEINEEIAAVRSRKKTYYKLLEEVQSLPEISIDEINEEIAQYRAKKK